MRLVGRIYDKAVFPAFFCALFPPCGFEGRFSSGAAPFFATSLINIAPGVFYLTRAGTFRRFFFNLQRNYEMSRYEEDDDIRTALLNMYRLGRQMTPRPKKEMTTRELLEQQLAGYVDDMEPRTPMPDPELEFDGNELYVKRNNVRQASWPAMAGQPGYQNRASTSVSDHGPTPEGLYYVNPDEVQERLNLNDRLQRFIQNPKLSLRNILSIVYPNGKESWMRDEDKWGNYRIPLRPADNTETYGRHSMYIHGSDELGSEGCTDLGNNMDQLAPYIKNSRQPVSVRVKYKSDDFER